MAMDLSSQLMAATVEVEQPLADGRHMIGTGFLINDPTADGRERIVLVTANHVFDKMPGAEAHIGFRVQDKDGAWRYDPQPLTIRAAGAPLWTRSPERDVAAIVVKVPPAFARAAIPLAWLADGDGFSRSGIGPGDEMLVLGYPQGLSANSAGFPILRSGRVASPVEATAVSPTFLLDFRVFPGNSGGPVFVAGDNRAADQAAATPIIAGMLTQQVELNSERLEIGIVTEAPFIRETVALLDKPRSTRTIIAEKATPPESVVQDASAWVGSKVAD
jgi:S1-C subfamily serine protease